MNSHVASPLHYLSCLSLTYARLTLLFDHILQMCLNISNFHSCCHILSDFVLLVRLAPLNVTTLCGLIGSCFLAGHKRHTKFVLARVDFCVCICFGGTQCFVPLFLVVSSRAVECLEDLSLY